MKNNLLKISLSAIFACLLWSTAATGIKIGLAYTTPLLFAGIRFLLAGLILIPLSKGFAGYIDLLRNHFKTVILLSLFQTVLLYVLFFEGLTLVPGAIGSIINGSGPLVAAVLCHFVLKNDKMTLRKFLTILTGVIGIVLITVSREHFTVKGAKEMLGIIMIFLSCISSAVGNIIVSGSKQKFNPITMNSLQIGLGGIMLLILSLIFEGPPVVHFTAAFSITLAWLTLVSAAGFSIWFSLLRIENVKVSELNIWKFIIPVFGAICSWLFLPGESPTLLVVCGMIIIAVSIVLFYSKTKVTGTK